MAGLASADASIPEKIAAFALPLAAGAAAAVHPAGARGLAGLTSAINTQVGLRELARRQEEERGLGMRLSNLMNEPTGQEVPDTGAFMPPATGGGTEAAEPARPPMRQQRVSEMLGGPQTKFIQALTGGPGYAREAAGILATQLTPRLPPAFMTVGEGQQIIDPSTGRVIATGQQKYRPPITAAPGHTVIEQGREPYTIPDRPEKPVPLSPGQKLVRPDTGAVVGGVPERPIVVAPGSTILDPDSGAVLFKAPDRPISLAPGGALVDPTSGQKVAQLPERPERGVVIEEIGPDGKPGQVLVDPVSGARRGRFGEKPTTTRPSDSNALRNQFLHQATTLGPVRDAYLTIEKVGQGKPTPFGDMSLLYSYIKLLDPNSAVREGEYATANNAQSVPDAVRTLYNRAINGELLTPTRRRDLVGQARNIAGARAQSHEQLEAEYRRIAQEQGLKPEEVVPDLLGEVRGRLKAPPPVGQAATRKDVARARRDAKGDPKRAIELLQERGFDTNLDVVEDK